MPHQLFVCGPACDWIDAERFRQVLRALLFACLTPRAEALGHIFDYAETDGVSAYRPQHVLSLSSQR